MTDWNKRDRFLTDVAERLLEAQPDLSLCRVHLVAPSGISRGTVYNHFPQESDLMLALCCRRYERALQQRARFAQQQSDPLVAFQLLHCWLLWNCQRPGQQQILRQDPGNDAQGSEPHLSHYRRLREQMMAQLEAAIAALSQDRAFDRVPLIASYVRGSLLQCSESPRASEDASLYSQYCYGLLQLLGRSDCRPLDQEQLSQQLAQWQGEPASPRLCA
ncbi:TetR/AcrR family transcriptional regulator [Ferrimonas marina]|uniref:Transcriptional regulator, TetR family n=1 Tax=Ferrimonas marina TaxID=299255 RepID=A0A1M5X8R5_9GAMM|nr:TetR/AcrR family transcriptional regulator [Ferrimonas marina]SHH96220.1 transcriptional regulator, TetR family [Ferrimonas marina]